MCNTNLQEIPLCQVSHSLFHCGLGGNWARVGGGSGGDGGGHNSTLCWLFPICWSFVDRRDRCWLQIPIRSEPRLILHEAGEVALNKMVSTRRCVLRHNVSPAQISPISAALPVCLAGTSASVRVFLSFFLSFFFFFFSLSLFRSL